MKFKTFLANYSLDENKDKEENKKDREFIIGKLKQGWRILTPDGLQTASHEVWDPISDKSIQIGFLASREMIINKEVEKIHSNTYKLKGSK